MADSRGSSIDFREEGSLHTRLFKISTEQQKILSKESAWHLSPSNIPPIVLDNVKEHLARQRDRASQIAPDISQNLPNVHEDIVENSAASQEVAVEAFDSQPEDSDHEDIPGSQWGSSPAHHRFPPGHVPEKIDCTLEDQWVATPVFSTNPPTQAFQNTVNAEEEDEEPAQGFLTQLPERSPPQPTAAKSLRPRRPTFDFPSSSLGQEDELEIDIPLGLGVPIQPTNLAFAPVMATPPSAQVVPCSLDPRGSHLHHEYHEHQELKPKPKSKAATKQTRYAAVTTLYRPPKEVEPLTKSVTSVLEEQHTESEKSSLPHTFPETSSSIVPSTHQDSSRPMDMSQEPQEPPGLLEQPIQVQASPMIEDLEGQLANATGAIVQPFETDELIYEDPSLPTAQLVSTVTVTKPDSPQQPRSRVDLAPYEQFCDTYKDYGGKLQPFITACFYIQLQQGKIHPSLYDDFIRAWHNGYCDYVKRCDRAEPPVKAVYAYAWYNAMDDDPIYTERVITKQNLEATLGFYPEIVKAVQKKTLSIVSEDQPKTVAEDKPKGSSDDQRRSPSAVMQRAINKFVDSSMIALSPPPQQQPRARPPPVLPIQAPIIIDDADDDEDDIDDDIPMEGPQVTIFSKHQQRRLSPPPAGFSKSMSEIDLRHQPSTASAAPSKSAGRSLARSFSEASKHDRKRKASGDIIAEIKAARVSPSMNGEPNKSATTNSVAQQLSTMRPPPRPAPPEAQLQSTFPSPSAFSTGSKPNSKGSTSVLRPKARVSLPAALETPSSSAISLSFRAPSSTAGSTTSVGTKKRRYANDPAKRSLMFKKFCERSVRKVNEESIMSSAPTSAQRE